MSACDDCGAIPAQEHGKYCRRMEMKLAEHAFEDIVGAARAISKLVEERRDCHGIDAIAIVIRDSAYEWLNAHGRIPF